MMDEHEKIPVYADIRNGRTVCICHAGKKGCGKQCGRDVVKRDRFFGWKNIMKRDRCGK